MNTKITLLLTFCFIYFSNCSRQPNTIDSYIGFDIQQEDLDQFLQSKMKEKDIPGLAIAFINQGEVVHHQTFGYANLEKQIPVTDQTIFEAASLSKSVFCLFCYEIRRIRAIGFRPALIYLSTVSRYCG